MAHSSIFLRGKRSKTSATISPAGPPPTIIVSRAGTLVSISQPLHPRMSAMRISVPTIDTTMEPMHPTLLEKIRTWQKENVGREWIAPRAVRPLAELLRVVVQHLEVDLAGRADLRSNLHFDLLG
jgi:hypothetical protein